MRGVWQFGSSISFSFIISYLLSKYNFEIYSKKSIKSIIYIKSNFNVTSTVNQQKFTDKYIFRPK